MYPILCPVIFPPPTLIHMGAAHEAISSALNSFSNQPVAGLAVPMISADWDRISGMNLTSTHVAEVPLWMRRLSDAGDMVSRYWREIAAKAALDSKSGTGISQHSLDLSQLNRARLAEFSPKPASRKSDPHAAPKSRWSLALYPQDKPHENPGQIFVNEDGRAIHLRAVTGLNVTLGYGWHNSLMHYVDIGARRDMQSVALFSNTDTHPSDLTPPWFLSLVQSMMEFYSAHYSPDTSSDAQVQISGTDLKRAPVKASGSWKDQSFLSRTFRTLSLSQDFLVETADLVSGYAIPSLQNIGPRVPQGAIRYAASEGRLTTSFYRSQKAPVPGETSLAPEQRQRLIFPKYSSRPPRP